MYEKKLVQNCIQLIYLFILYGQTEPRIQDKTFSELIHYLNFYNN